MCSINFLIVITACALAVTLMITSCRGHHRTDSRKLCGRWQSVSGRPDVLIFKEGSLYKMTVFKKSLHTQALRPETYLIIEEGGYLFINTAFRIDIGYDAISDVLTFSTHGDYTRVSHQPQKTH